MNPTFFFQHGVEGVTELMIKAQLSGASPTQYATAGMVWHGLLEQNKAAQAKQRTPRSPSMERLSVVQDGFYPVLHQTAFMEPGQENMIVENAQFDELDERDPNGNTVLMWAASEGNRHTVELLVDQGAPVNTQNFEGETALFLAAARGHHGLVDFLLKNGGDARLTNLDGASPLHIAAAGGHVATISVLVKNGAFVHSLDEAGDSPLHYAVRESKKQAVDFLVNQCGASPVARNEDGESALDLAIEFEEAEIAQLLGGEPSEATFEDITFGRNAMSERFIRTESQAIPSSTFAF